MTPNTGRLLNQLLKEALNMRVVVKSVKENKKPTFTEWTEQNGYVEVKNEWFNKRGFTRNSAELIEMYLEEHQL